VPSDKEILNLQGNAGNRRNGMEKWTCPLGLYKQKRGSYYAVV
jgi:hypothetical protein